MPDEQNPFFHRTCQRGYSVKGGARVRQIARLYGDSGSFLLLLAGVGVLAFQRLDNQPLPNRPG